MPQKLFVLGLPGSGKSTIARHIVHDITHNHKHDEWLARGFGDYDILYKMFEEDKQQKHFYPIEHEGFYVKTPDVYDKALEHLEQDITSHCYGENELIVIEFARNDYIHALSNFSEAFLRDAYFLFLNVDLGTAMKRVRDRVKHPHSSDDHFVSDHTFEFYRRKDNTKYLMEVARHITRQYGIAAHKIKIMNNHKGLKKDFWNFVEKILQMAPVVVW